MSPDEQAAFRSGYSDPVIARIENTRSGTNSAGALTGDKFAAEAAEIAIDPELLARRVGRENTMFDTKQRVLGGSLTADNVTDVAASRGVGQDILSSLMQGRLRDAATQTISAGANAATGRNSEVRELLGKMLMSQGGEAASAVRGATALQGSRDLMRKRLMDALISGSAVGGGVSQ